MKFIEPSITELTILDPIDKIAKVARNCYLSTPKTDDESEFVSRLVARRHFAVIEHQNFTFKVPHDLYMAIHNMNNPFIYMTDIDGYYVTLSLRPLLERYLSDDFKDPIMTLIPSLPKSCIELFFPEYDLAVNPDVKLLSLDEVKSLPSSIRDKHLFITMKIITDRGVTHELVRHRRCSYAQESTRYCNYAKDKFNNELTFIKPLDYEANKDIYDDIFSRIETAYIELTKRVSLDYARSILPISLKTSIMVTANLEEWKLIFDLRTSPAAHPDIRKVMNMVKEHFIECGYLEGQEICN